MHWMGTAGKMQDSLLIGLFLWCSMACGVSIPICSLVCVLVAPVLIQFLGNGLGKAAKDFPSVWPLSFCVGDWEEVLAPSLNWQCWPYYSRLRSEPVYERPHPAFPSLSITFSKINKSFLRNELFISTNLTQY